MKKPQQILVFAVITFLFLSCATNSEKPKKIITERIQYDVFIKSPNDDRGWWIENIEGVKRESFVKRIIDDAKSGKYRTYDYFNEPLSKEAVARIFNYIDTLKIESSVPPYEERDTIIHHKLDINDIAKVRFLEEWYVDESSLEIEKKIVGIAPIRENYSPNGELRGYTPLLWIYLDDKYPVQ